MAVISVFGRLTGDPESKQGNSGPIIHFSIADNHGKDKDGKDRVTFFRCSAFGKQGEMIMNSCKKSHRLNVSGRYETSQYTNNQGVQVTSHDVSVQNFDFIEPRDTSQAATAQTPAPSATPAPAPAAQPTFQYDAAGNGWSLINNQWQMTHPARVATPPVQAAPPFTPAPPAPPATQKRYDANGNEVPF